MVKNFIHAINSISPSILGFVLILIGAGLTIHNTTDVGKELVVGGFALVTGGRMQHHRETDTDAK